jgi:hypothetical protein
MLLKLRPEKRINYGNPVSSKQASKASKQAKQASKQVWEVS